MYISIGNNNNINNNNNNNNNNNIPLNGNQHPFLKWCRRKVITSTAAFWLLDLCRKVQVFLCGRPRDHQIVVKEPFLGTSWFSQQTDDYFFQLSPFYSLVQCNEVSSTPILQFSELNECYVHFYISQETSCLEQTEC